MFNDVSGLLRFCFVVVTLIVQVSARADDAASILPRSELEGGISSKYAIERPANPIPLRNLRVIEDKTEEEFYARAVWSSPDEIITAHWGGGVTAWNVKTGVQTWKQDYSATRVDSLELSKDSQFVVVGGEGGLLKILHAKDGTLSRDFSHDKETWYTRVCFSPDGNTLAAGTVDGDVEVWDVPTGIQKHVFAAHAWPLNALSFDPSGNFLYSGDVSTLKLWEIEKAEAVRTISGSPSDALFWFSSVTFSKDLNYVVAGTYTDVRVIDLRDASLLVTVGNQEMTVLHASLSDDHKTLLSVGRDHTVRKIDVETGIESSRKYMNDLPPLSYVNTFTSDSDMKRFVVGTMELSFSRFGSFPRLRIYEY